MSPRRKLTGEERVKIFAEARKYVDAQLSVMEKFGSKPKLTEMGYKYLIAQVAKPAIEIAEWRKGE